MECLSDKRMQEYANMGINVVGFKPRKSNTDVEDGFGKLIAVGLVAEIVSIIAMVAGVM